MQSRRLCGVIARVQIVAVTQVGLVRRLFVATCGKMRGGLGMVLGRRLKMLGCLSVMVDCIIRHVEVSLDYPRGYRASTLRHLCCPRHAWAPPSFSQPWTSMPLPSQDSRARRLLARSASSLDVAVDASVLHSVE